MDDYETGNQIHSQSFLKESRLFFSSVLTGPVKKEFITLCILFWSPGARVGQAWLNVVAMKGIQAAVDTSVVSVSLGIGGDARGMAMGTLGLEVAEVGKGGNERISGVSPGAKTTTTLWIKLRFWGTKKR